MRRELRQELITGAGNFGERAGASYPSILRSYSTSVTNNQVLAVAKALTMRWGASL